MLAGAGVDGCVEGHYVRLKATGRQAVEELGEGERKVIGKKRV